MTKFNDYKPFSMKKYIILLLVLTLTALFGCDKDTNEQENVISETSVTGYVESITPLGATLVCYANLPIEISAGTSFGVLYSTDENPTFETSNSRVSNELNPNNQYSITISGLQPATKYYFRSFVNQNGIIKYGRIKDFTTSNDKILITGIAEKISAISASIPIEIDLTKIKYKEIRLGICYCIDSVAPDLYRNSFTDGYLYNNKCSISLMSLNPNTTYHYRAYAIIDGSLIYGDCLSFITKQDSLAMTNEPTEITHISAVVSGNIDLTDCSYQSALWGICYDEIDNPSLESKVVTTKEIENETIIAKLIGLEPDKVYYYRSFVTIDNITHYGDVMCFRTLELFKDIVVNNVGSISAKVKTTYNISGVNYSSSSFGICYNDFGNPTISDKVKISEINNEGVIEIDILGLNQGSKYFIRPYAELDGKLFYGQELDFTTLGLITGSSASDISGVSSKITVSYDLSNAIYDNGEFGICYGTTPEPTNVVLGELSNAEVSVIISALQSKTKYYYRGCAKIDGKVYYGEEHDFTTLQFVGPGQISNISPISATGSVEYDINNAIIDNAEYGICLSTGLNPTINDIQYNGSLDYGSLLLDIKKLSPATSYYYRGYAIVDGTIHYGEINRFSTGECRFMTTGQASNITFCSAILSAKYDLSNSMYDSVEFGMCYSNEPTPTIHDYTATGIPDDNGNVSFSINNLICSTEYYYRPYVTIDGATYYGNQRMFETAWDPFVVAEIEAGRLVDLGLSVHWASCNVGALKPEDVGSKYAWGEIATKETYSWQNYKFTQSIYNDNPRLSKYVEQSGVELSESDDVATVKLGGTYRMPRESEIDELINKCSWTWTDVNSVKGYKITGPNGNSFFLPCERLIVSGTELWHGYYWSKTRFSDSYGSTKWAVCILTTGVTEQPSNNSHEKYYHNRCDGFYVRPVSPY